MEGCDNDDELLARKLQKEEEDLQLSLCLARQSEDHFHNSCPAAAIFIDVDENVDAAAAGGDLQLTDDLLMAERLQDEVSHHFIYFYLFILDN
jgi:hypothetical protein